MKNSSTKSSKAAQLQSLYSLNLVAAVIFVLQAVVILVLGKEVSWNVVTNFLTTDPLAANSQASLSPASHVLFSLNPQHLAIIWLSLSALMHLLLITKARKSYQVEVASGSNRYRWLQAAVCNSLVILVVGMAVGVRDIASLVLLLGLGIFVHSIGLTIDKRKDGTNSKFLYNYATLAGLAIWFTIGAYAWSNIVYGRQSMDAYVYGLLAALVVSCSSFAAVVYLAARSKQQWANKIYVERTLIMLLIASQSLPAWLLLAAK